MKTAVVQRWRSGRAAYRPAREVVDTRRLDVAPIEWSRARAFVAEHHYLGTMPAQARLRFGLYDRGALVGAAVFSRGCAGVGGLLPDPATSVELGRLVLLDEVLANAESWFVARCFEALRREGLSGVVAFSDDHARRTTGDELVFAGHIGTVYQALNATYTGRTRAHGVLVLPDGRILNARSLAKARAGVRGGKAQIRRLESYGAPPCEGDTGAWLDRVLPSLTRRERHPGCHRYVWALRPADRRHLPAGQPYPKVRLPLFERIT